MKTFVIACLCIIVLSCKNDTTSSDAPIQSNPATKTFQIDGNVGNTFVRKAYLQKIFGSSVIKVDSSIISNSEFKFIGQVETPERYGISFDNNATMAIFVLENQIMKMSFNEKELNDPKITGSVLNDELTNYKQYAKSIFKKIDYLFPEFQKARLDNDATKLTEIGAEMKKIEEEFRNYSFNYIAKHPNSYVSAMILRDQLKASYVDSLRIRSSFNTLSQSVQLGIDGLIVAEFLELYDE